MSEYNYREIEQKWQKNWDENKTFKTNVHSEKKKFYALDMFPYPSGSGLHVGHPEGYTATDIIARMKRMQGYEVMHPMGWDAFGLPAEQYAIQTGNHPGEFTKKNIANFKNQIKSLGFSYDWDRELSTTDPSFYKWSQWIFIKLYENGLAELKDMPVNFCPECGTVLANEEVIDGRCERKGHLVEKKSMQQWVLKITKYAERLLEDLEDLDWPESLKDMQRNWIGKSEGANILFKTEQDIDIQVYTTKPHTIFGVSALVLAFDHSNASKFVTLENKDEVEEYINQVKNKSELERTELNKDKSGVFTGSYATHPITNEPIAIYLADYVLANYATGSVMCVPAHDQRDYEFGKKYDLDFKVIIDGDLEKGAIVDEGVLINSDFLNDLSINDADNKLISYLIENKLGSKEVKYKLRDWLFSRQRYWGEPFPIVHLNDGSIKVVNENELPIKLPQLDKIQPSQDGTSPLINAKDWLNTTYEGQPATRETNTMPQWAGSCWYYLRYLDPTNQEALIDPKIAEKWLPVDLYIGGAEHAVLHLLYARFWHKFLYDIKVVSTKEPFQKLYNQGMILGEGNEKMSKSKGNVVNPDDIIISHGADTLRLYEMFMGPLDASIAWSEDGLDGAKRFLDRVWRLYQNSEIVESVEELEISYHKTVKKVTNDFEKLSFNTAISQLMVFVNDATKLNKLSLDQAIGFIKLLSPIAPHISEEIYSNLISNEKSISYAKWPTYDETKLIENDVEIIIQVNGKIKKKIKITRDLDQKNLIEIAKKQIDTELANVTIIKEIAVVNRLVNFVVK